MADREAATTTAGSGGVMKMAVRRLTSRAALIRQTSVALLRKNTTPSLLRKTSATNLFPEFDDVTLGPGIHVYYYSGWQQPHLHYTTEGGAWTAAPGAAMAVLDAAAKEAAHLPAYPPRALKDETVCYLHVKAVDNLEFVPNDNGRVWDKAPGNNNYRIVLPGRYVLRNGQVQQLLDPPQKPALFRATAVGTTHVNLVWNPPVAEPELVAGFELYRDDILVTKLGETAMEYKDEGLLGLSKYSYVLKAVNSLGAQGAPSETVLVETGEPGKPSAPQELTVEGHSKTSINLHWKLPADHGGSLIKAYHVYRNGCLHAVVTGQSSGETKYCDTTRITDGCTYIYHVSALNKSSTVSLVPTGDRTETSASFSSARAAEGFMTPEADAVDAKTTLAATPQPDATFEDREQYYRAATSRIQDKNEGILSDGVEAAAVQMIVQPRIGDGRTHIILQAFNWNSCKNKAGWYKVLQSKVDLMRASNFTMVWLPPPCASVSDDGYMPTKWYNLNTKYGTAAELKELNDAMTAQQMAPMLDLVVNHRCGTKQDENGDWTIYEEPAWAKWAIVNNNVQGYQAEGSADTGTQSECAPDIDHTNRTVRHDIKTWCKWLFSEVGFGSIRIDMAPGYSVGYQVEYLDHVGAPFAVGEYWNGDPTCLQNYVHGGRGKIAAFDFALYYVLRRCVEENNYTDLRDNNKAPGLLGRDPERSVTFIDNHDTEHLDFVGRFGNGNGDLVLRGYTYLLTHPGTPCVYWNHFSDYGDQMRKQIAALCSIREKAGITSSAGVHIAVAQWGLYAAYINKERHCGHGQGVVAVKIGSNNWSPEGGGWNKAVEGNGLKVWTRH